MQAKPNLNFKPTKAHIRLFLRNFISRLDKQYTVTSKEMSTIFYFQQFKTRPRPHEQDKLNASSRLFGKCLTEFAHDYPNVVQKINNKNCKYILKPIN